MTQIFQRLNLSIYQCHIFALSSFSPHTHPFWGDLGSKLWHLPVELPSFSQFTGMNCVREKTIKQLTTYLGYFWARNLHFVSCWQFVFLPRHTISRTLNSKSACLFSQSSLSLQFFVSSFQQYKAHITYSNNLLSWWIFCRNGGRKHTILSAY